MSHTGPLVPWDLAVIVGNAIGDRDHEARPTLMDGAEYTVTAGRVAPNGSIRATVWRTNDTDADEVKVAQVRIYVKQVAS